MKKLKKMIPIGMGKTTASSVVIDPWKPFWEWRHKNTITNTGNPKGKLGKLVTIPYFMRTFKQGNKRWEWRLFGHKHGSAFNDAASFIDRLKKRGFVELGHGAFSTVLGKEGKDRVIKVIRRSDPWIDYAVWAAKEGEAGRLAPKVFSYKTIKGAKRDFSVAVMERLEYTFFKTPKDHVLKILPGLLAHSNHNAIASQFADMLSPGVVSFFDKMTKRFGEDNLDIHNGNFMVRNDGTFVVVDPVAGLDPTSPKRLKAGDFSPVVSLLEFLVAHHIRHRSEWIRKSYRDMGHSL